MAAHLVPPGKQDAESLGTARTVEHIMHREGEEALLTVPCESTTLCMKTSALDMEKGEHHARDISATTDLHWEFSGAQERSTQLG